VAKHRTTKPADAPAEPWGRPKGFTLRPYQQELIDQCPATMKLAGRSFRCRLTWAATTEGIAELRQLCAKHPGSLVLIDSFAKVSEKLGIDEDSREAPKA
jgi:hypothetical protein